MRADPGIDRRSFLNMMCASGALAATACTRRPAQPNWSSQIGERVTCGGFIYTVLEIDYKSQLGAGVVDRRPKKTFIAIRLQATNSGGEPKSVPFLTLEPVEGDPIPEVQDAGSLDGWFGVFRKIEPGASETGWIVFDADPGDYGLILSDGSLTEEHKASVKIPVKMGGELKQ